MLMDNDKYQEFMVLAFVDDGTNPPHFDATFFHYYSLALCAVSAWDDKGIHSDIYYLIKTRAGYRFVVLDDFIGAIVKRFEKEE